jgi:hypothetical protein
MGSLIAITRKPEAGKNRRMMAISERDLAPWNSSINDTIEIARPDSDSINALAFRSPRKNQIRTSVSKITEPALPQLAHVRGRVAEIRPVLPEPEGFLAIQPGALFRQRHDASFCLAAVENRYCLASLYRFKNILRAITEIQNCSLHVYLQLYTIFRSSGAHPQSAILTDT